MIYQTVNLRNRSFFVGVGRIRSKYGNAIDRCKGFLEVGETIMVSGVDINGIHVRHCVSIRGVGRSGNRTRFFANTHYNEA